MRGKASVPEATLFAVGTPEAARDNVTGNADVASLRGLNRGQRQAVEHTGGPLIVLAGPGTGKTRVITQRIGHLVQVRGVDPSSIVAVTFTTKAAEQLRERLTAMVGDRVARRVNAHTIHGFGLRILKRYADLLDLPPIGGDGRRQLGLGGRVRRCDLIDSAQAKRMLRRLILDEDLFGHARAAGLESLVSEALRLFDGFDNHALTAEDVAAFVRKWGEALERGCDVRGGVLDEAGLAAGRAAQVRFADFVRLHASFDRERRAAGLLTYGDLLVLPIRLLRERPEAAARCRAEFRHWLVDEFQDVNAAQIELLRLLAPPSASGAEGRGPDLCVVGDDDQAIYGFRGADDQAFRHFAALWRGAEVVKLTENYRSRPRIITVANSIIARAESRFAPDKRIEPAVDGVGAPDGIIECVQLRDEMEDSETIASLIRIEAAEAARTDQGGRVPAGFYRRTAVVARSHGDLDRIEEALWLEGVPTVRWKKASAAEEDGVRDVLAWLRLLASPHEPWPARRLLTRPPLGVSLEQVNAWDQQYRAEVSRWKAAEPRGEEPAERPGLFAAWLRRVLAQGMEGCVAEGDRSGAERLCRWFDEFSAAAAQESAAALIVRIVRETGVVHADLPDDRQRARRVEAIVAVLNFAQARQGRLSAPGGVREFLEYYDDLSADEQGFEGSTDPQSADEGLEPEGVEGIDAVRLITGHASKGLEFDTVFVPRINSPHGYPKTRSQDEIEWPDGLVSAIEESDADGDPRLSEERRLFYVACTRAERRLVLLSKRNKNKSKSVNFFEELTGDEAIRGQLSVVVSTDVLAQAARQAGMGAGGVGVDALRGLRGGNAEAAAGAGGVRDRRRELFERARRDARLSAAGALSRVDVAGVSESEVQNAKRVLEETADRLAAIAAVESGGTATAWVGRLNGPARSMIEALVKACAVEAAEGKKAALGRSAWAGRVPVPPLALSYTAIYDYLRCPRCYYAKYVLNLQGPEGEPAVMGIALHRALERFYQRFRDADASGQTPPGLTELTAMAREEFFEGLATDSEVDQAELDRLMAQVRVGFERLHTPDIHVLETEWAIEFDYDSAAAVGGGGGGSTHRMKAKIDRIDQVTLSDGGAGFRIVDYKTGAPRKALLQPDAKDLQLGIYALALREEFGEDIVGTAEYWVFSTGERGVVSLADINEAGVRKQIDKAIAGILAGNFEQSKDCKDGLCQILGPAGAA